jgi:NTE family protein
VADLSLALSGGGAAGFGHVIVLETLDELGVRPCAIAGTSAGAVIGAAYASGLSGAEIRDHVLDLVDKPLDAARVFWRAHLSTGLNLLRPIAPRAAIETVLPDTVPQDFSDLDIPLTVVATDYRARKARAFDSGPLHAALAASVAIPGVFAPLKLEGRLYVDGGVSNNLPYDLLPEGSFRLAVDVATEPEDSEKNAPGALEVVAGSMRILMQSLLEARLERSPPEALIRPDSRRFGIFDVRDAEEILAAAAPAAEETKRAVAACLDAP